MFSGAGRVSGATPEACWEDFGGMRGAAAAALSDLQTGSQDTARLTKLTHLFVSHHKTPVASEKSENQKIYLEKSGKTKSGTRGSRWEQAGCHEASGDQWDQTPLPSGGNPVSPHQFEHLPSNL